MGVDTVITLPANVTLDHVADVIGKLLGCEAVKRPLLDREPNGAWFVEVTGVAFTGSTVPSCAQITVKCPNGDERWFFYHFEGPGGTRQILPPSTPENIALGRGLVDFFGGTVLYSDCSSQPFDYEVTAKIDAVNAPENGKPWQRLQERIYKLKPLKGT